MPWLIGEPQPRGWLRPDRACSEGSIHTPRDGQLTIARKDILFGKQHPRSLHSVFRIMYIMLNAVRYYAGLLLELHQLTGLPINWMDWERINWTDLNSQAVCQSAGTPFLARHAVVSAHAVIARPCLG